MITYLNEISGIPDAIVSMFMSKRSWTRKFEAEIRESCSCVLDRTGRLRENCPKEELERFTDWINKLVKLGWMHTTLLRFIDMSITVEGLHRAGQDDWDAHSPRFNNRIIRSSTRLANFDYEMSMWYNGRIIPTDIALKKLGIVLPDEIDIDETIYTKAVNGYIRSDLANDPDTKRGLYMLSIPSNFIFKINLTEWGHVYKERNANGNSNPEVKECCESISDQIQAFHKQFNRDLFQKIKN